MSPRWHCAPNQHLLYSRFCQPLDNAAVPRTQDVMKIALFCKQLTIKHTIPWNDLFLEMYVLFVSRIDSFLSLVWVCMLPQSPHNWRKTFNYSYICLFTLQNYSDNYWFVLNNFTLFCKQTWQLQYHRSYIQNVWKLCASPSHGHLSSFQARDKRGTRKLPSFFSSLCDPLLGSSTEKI